MGSFNISCFASNQVISERQKCRVFGVIQSGTFNPVKLTKGDLSVSMFGASRSTCYPSAYWEPVSSSLEATYADYGTFEFDLSGSNKLIAVQLLGEIFKKSFVAEEGDNQSHEPAFDFKAFVSEKAPALFALLSKLKRYEEPSNLEGVSDEEVTLCLDLLQDCAWSSRVFLEGYNGSVRAFRFAVISEIAYQRFITHRESLKTWEDLPLDRKSYIERSVIAAHERVARSKTIRSELASTREFTEVDGSFAFVEGLRESVFRSNEGTISVFQRTHTEKLYELSKAVYEDKTMSDEQLVENLIPLVGDTYMVSTMGDLNLPITPLMYAGQDYENKAGESYAKLVQEISVAVIEDIDEMHYGKPRLYTAEVSTESISRLTQLEDYFNDCDSYLKITNVETHPRESGSVSIMFKCPLELADIQDCLDSFSEIKLNKVSEVSEPSI